MLHPFFSETTLVGSPLFRFLNHFAHRFCEQAPLVLAERAKCFPFRRVVVCSGNADVRAFLLCRRRDREVVVRVDFQHIELRRRIFGYLQSREVVCANVIVVVVTTTTTDEEE